MLTLTQISIQLKLWDNIIKPHPSYKRIAYPHLHPPIPQLIRHSYIHTLLLPLLLASIFSLGFAPIPSQASPQVSSKQASGAVPIANLVSESSIQGLNSVILGSIKQVREGFHQAVTDYRAALKHRQDIPLLYLDVIHYHAALKQFSEAENVLTVYPPESPYFPIGEAIIAYHQKKPDRVIEKLLTHHDNPLHIIHRLIILSHLALLDETSAINHLQKITQAFPPEWHAQAALLILPSILEETIRLSEPLTQALRAMLKKAIQSEQSQALLAAVEFEIFIEKPLLALDLLRRAVRDQKRPELPLLIRLADLENQYHSPQAALPYYLQAFKRNPDHPHLRESLAKLYTQLQQYDLALPHWQAINQEHPTQIQPLIEIALIHEKNKDHAQALKAWQQALILNPRQPHLHIAVILAKLTIQDIDGALKDAQAFTKQFPTHPRSHYLEGIIQFDLKNYTAANVAFSQAEILAATADPQLLDPQFYIQRAIIFEHLSQPRDAAETLHRAHIKFPENIVIMNNLAYSWAELNIELEKALTLSLKTVEAEPPNASYLDTLGWIYYRLNKHTEAITWLEKAHKIEPDNAIILDHLADVYASTNNLPKALELWEKALQHHDKPQEIQKKIAQAKTAAPTGKTANKHFAPLTQNSSGNPAPQ